MGFGAIIGWNELPLDLAGVGSVAVLRLYEFSGILLSTFDERIFSESLLLMIGRPMIFESGNTSVSGTFSGITNPRSLDMDFFRCSSKLVIDDFLLSSTLLLLLIVARLLPLEYPEKLVVLDKILALPNIPPLSTLLSPFEAIIPLDGFKFSTLYALPNTTGFDVSSPNLVLYEPFSAVLNSATF